MFPIRSIMNDYFKKFSGFNLKNFFTIQYELACIFNDPTVTSYQAFPHPLEITYLHSTMYHIWYLTWNIGNCHRFEAYGSYRCLIDVKSKVVDTRAILLTVVTSRWFNDIIIKKISSASAFHFRLFLQWKCTSCPTQWKNLLLHFVSDIRLPVALIHLPLVPHICVSKSG